MQPGENPIRNEYLFGVDVFGAGDDVGFGAGDEVIGEYPDIGDGALSGTGL